MTKCLFAHTDPGNALPAYINVAQDARGVIVTVRGTGQQYGNAMLLEPEKAREMANAILGNAHNEAGPVPTKPR